MKHIESVEVLLFSVARKGDPSAFFALFEDRIEALVRYVINTEQDAESARDRLDVGMQSIYSRFFQASIKQPAHYWFEQQLLEEFGFSDNSEDAGVSESAPVTECKETIMVGLQKRHHSLFNKQGAKSPKGFTAQHKRRIVIGGIVLAVLVTAGYFILKQTDSTISLRWESPQKRIIFSFPLASKDSSEAVDSTISVDSVSDTIDSNVVADSSDTLSATQNTPQKSPVVRNSISKKPQPSVATGRKRKPAPRAKKSPSAEAVSEPKTVATTRTAATSGEKTSTVDARTDKPQPTAEKKKSIPAYESPTEDPVRKTEPVSNGRVASSGQSVESPLAKTSDSQHISINESTSKREEDMPPSIESPTVSTPVTQNVSPEPEPSRAETTASSEAAPVADEEPVE